MSHEWEVLKTASAAFSHREGSMVTRVAVQSRGPRSTHRVVTYLHHMAAPPYACVWLCVRVRACADKQLAVLITYTHPYQSTHSSPARAAPDDSE